jgi:DNA-binding GntR family transcriptional regulator
VWPRHHGQQKIHDRSYVSRILRRGELVTRKLAPQWNEAIDDHEDILTVLHRRDGAHLATIMRDHVWHKATVT